MPVTSRPGAAGSSAPQRAESSARAAASPTLAATGQQVGQRPGLDGAALAGPAGTQATRTPVARESASSAEKAPGTSARRSPASTTAPGSRSASIAGPPQVPSARACSDCASAPGSVVRTVACSFSAARVANGARSKTGSLRVRTARRSRRKTIGDSSSGSNPASRTAGRRASSS